MSLTYCCFVLLVVSLSFAELPLRFVSNNKERESSVETLLKLPDSLECALNDFMPHLAEVSYSINFSEFIRVNHIEKNGRFVLRQMQDSSNSSTPWLIEGVNRLTIISKNIKGLSNRQSSVIQIFTTPSRLEILWPPADGTIRESNPAYRLLGRVTYEGDLESIIPSTAKLYINGSQTPIKVDARDWSVTSETDSGFILSSNAPKSVDIRISPESQPECTTVTINSSVSIKTGSIGSNSSTDIKAFWSFTIDTVTPQISLSGPSSVRQNDSIIRFTMTLSDNMSNELKDVRVRLYENNKGNWRHIESHNRFYERLPTGTHYESEPLTANNSGLVSKIAAIFTGSLLPEGEYKLEVRARDCAYNNRLHFLNDRKLQRAYRNNRADSIEVLFKTFYEPLYNSSSDDRLNWAIDTLIFSIDNTAPIIFSNKTGRTELTSTSPDKNLKITWQLSEPCTLRWAIDKIIHFTNRENRNDTFYTEALRGETYTGDTGSVNFDLGNHQGFFRDGMYRSRLVAIDLAGHRSDTSFGSPFSVDFTPPIIREMVVPDLVIDGIPKQKNSSQSAIIGDKGSLKLRFSVLNIFAADTFPTTSANLKLFVVKPDGSDSMLNLAHLEMRADETIANTWGIQTIPGSAFNRGNGRYQLRLEASDSRVFPNTAKRHETVVKGCIPPKITSPRPFSENYGKIAIEGVAKDPDWSDSIRFSHYEIEYRKWKSDEGWRTAGITITSSNPVENGLLGIFDMTVNNLEEGFYEVRLITFDRSFIKEIHDDPLGASENNGSWAADTTVLFLYKEPLLNEGAQPELSIVTPKENPVKFNGRDFKNFGVRIAGKGTKLFNTRLSIESETGEVVADTNFTNMTIDSSGRGAPGSFSRLGLFVYKQNDKWHLRWNGAGSSSKYTAFVRFSGKVADFSDPKKCCDIEFAETDNAINTILVNDSVNGEISFRSDASFLEINAQIYPHRDNWIFIGSKAIQYGSGLFTVGAATERTYKWNGKNRYGFYPVPGRYTIKATAFGVNGNGYVECINSSTFGFPNGIKIDGLSDTLFEMDTSTFYREMTIRYRPFGTGYLSCFLVDTANNSTPIFIDSLVHGRSDSAEVCSYTWNLNIRGNQLIPEGRYKIAMRLSRSLKDSLPAFDTSGAFTFRIVKVISNPEYASLSVNGDTVINYQGSNAAVVSGKSDFRWLAHGTGLSYPDIPFRYKYKASGSQLVHPHKFQRFTVKARRGFKKVNYKIRMYLEANYYERDLITGNRILSKPKSYGTRFITNDKSTLNNLTFTDSIDGLNSHPVIFTCETEKRNFRYDAFSANNGLPTLHVYILKGNFSGSEDKNSWDNAALEKISIPSNKIANSEEFYAQRKEIYYKSVTDEGGEYILEKEYLKLIQSNPDTASYFKITEGTQYGDFRVVVRNASKSPNSSTKFYKYSVNMEVGIRPEAWDKNYKRHGFNSIVNRYTTWDSENSIYYDKGKGIIALDGLDNDFDGAIDATKTNKNISEDLIRYVSDQHVQAFNFKYLTDKKNRSGYYPLFFPDCEDGLSPILEDSYWEFRLACRPDAGTYTRFGWSTCFNTENNPANFTNYVARATRSENMQDKIRIDGDNGPRAIMVYCVDPEVNGLSSRRIDWPITLNGIDSLNLVSTDLLAQKYPGTDTSLRFIPKFNGSVRYGPEDGLDLNSDGHIDAIWYNPPAESIQVLKNRLKGAPETEFNGEGKVALKENGEYSCNIVGMTDAKKFGTNVLSSMKVTAIESTIPLKADTYISSGTGGVSFAPISGAPLWSTSEDPNLYSISSDVIDSIDNNNNLLIDEDASGFVQSPPIPFNPHGFAFKQECHIVDGYPKSLLNGTAKTLYNGATKGGFIEDNRNTRAENWQIDIRHINGEPNREFEITSIDAGSGSNALNDLYDRFTVKLKDNVFVPKRLVEIHGIAWGDEYKLLARNGSGWNQIRPIITQKEINTNSSARRTLAFWDVGGLCGGNTLLLQVKRNGHIFQALQTVFAGQHATLSDQTVYSTHSRSRVDLKDGSLSAWGDTAFVSITPRKLTELKLGSTPRMNPVGPVMELRPSPTNFTIDNRPKLTMHFTYNEAKSNGWLDANFNLYNIRTDGTLDIIENSVTTYFSTDQNGTPINKLSGKAEFEATGENTGGLAIMQIAAETDHWSNFAAFKRAARTFYVNCNIQESGKGKEWKDAFKTIDEAVRKALSGDTIKIHCGTNYSNFNINKNLVIAGGFTSDNRHSLPAINQTIIRSRATVFGDIEISGIVFDSGFAVTESYCNISRCAFKNGLFISNSSIALTHSSLHNVNISGCDLSFISATNSVFSSVKGWKRSISGEGNAFWNGITSKTSICNSNPLLMPDLRLARNSPLIDIGVKTSSDYSGVAPDIGFHEFIGDTFFVSAIDGRDNNEGNKNYKPLATINAAVAKCNDHDIIVATDGIHSVPPTINKSVSIIGSFNKNFSARSTGKTPTIIESNIVFDKPVRISGVVVKNGSITHHSSSQWDTSGFINQNASINFTGARTAGMLNNCWFHNNSNSVYVNNGAVTNGNRLTISQPDRAFKVAKGSELKIFNSIVLEQKQLFTYTDTAAFKFNAVVFWPPLEAHKNVNGIMQFNPLLAYPDTVNLHPLPHSPCAYKGTNRTIIGAFEPLRYKVQQYAQDTTPGLEFIGISGRYMRNNAKPFVKFKNIMPGDSCIVLLNNKLIRRAIEIYDEGRYNIKGLVFRNGIPIKDTSLVLTIDFTPPAISASNIPPFTLLNWTKGHDNIYERTDSKISSNVVVKDSYLKSSEIRINGKKLAGSSIIINNEGEYTLNITAEDSSGNISRELIVFRLIKNDNSFRLFVTQPNRQDSTSENKIPIHGYVNSSSATIIINKDTISSIKHADSTSFISVATLDYGSNTFNIKALSRISGKIDQKLIRIFRDTTPPSISISEPVNGSIATINAGFAFIALRGQIASNGSIRKLAVTTPLEHKNIEVKKIGNEYHFSDSLYVADERLHFPIQIIAENRFGLSDTILSTISIAIPPRIVHLSPSNGSYIRTQTIQLSGIIIDSGIKRVSISNTPVDFHQSNDTTYYSGSVALSTDTENEFRIVAEDLFNATDTAIVRLMFDNISPIITISSPANNHTTGESAIAISGTIDDNTATIFCGTDTIKPPHASIFTFYNINLASGVNTITVNAFDAAGNYSEPTTIRIIKNDNSVIYVDNSHTGIESGTERQPYKTLTKGVEASTAGSTIIIKQGNYTESAAFKSNQRIQSECGGVILDCGNTPFRFNGSIAFDNLNFTGSGRIIEGSGGQLLSMTRCTLQIEHSGIEINNMVKVNLSYFKAYCRNGIQRPVNTVFALNTCDTVAIYEGRIDSCGDAGIALSNCNSFVLRKILFNNLGSEGVQLTSSRGTVEYCTFANNTSGINISGGQTSIYNTIIAESRSFAVSRLNSDIIAGYSCFYKNALGWSQSTIGLDSQTTIFSDPLFMNRIDFDINPSSPAKFRSSTGGEIGWKSQYTPWKKAATVSLMSLTDGICINKSIPIRMSKSRFDGDLASLSIKVNNAISPVVPATESDSPDIWGYTPLQTIDSGNTTIRVVNNAIETFVFFRNPVIAKEGDSVSILGLVNKKSNSQTVRFVSERGWIIAFNMFNDTLFKLTGSPVLASTDSFFVNMNDKDYRLWRYRFAINPENRQTTSTLSDNKAGIEALHFLPSPYKPALRKNGVIRYRLTADSDTRICIYDRTGAVVREWNIHAGFNGGKAGVNEISWNGKTNSHTDCVSGIYIVEIKLAGKSEENARARFALKR